MVAPGREAVIVSAVRSPIGRARKGSLAGMRPDDLTAQVVRAALDAVPALDPTEVEDLLLGCGLPGGEQGHNLARIVAVQLGHGHPARRDDHAVLLVVGADRAHGRARHPRRRGRRLPRRRRRDRLAVRQGQLRQPARHAQPAVRRRRGPHGRGGRGRRDRVARPARRRPAPRRLHRDGADRRERGAGRGRDARGDGPLRRALAAAGGRRSAERLLGARDHPGDAARRLGDGARRQPARRAPPTPHSPTSSRSSVPTGASPPATPARSTTAPPRSW